MGTLETLLTIIALDRILHTGSINFNALIYKVYLLYVLVLQHVRVTLVFAGTGPNEQHILVS